jgi:ParB-like nuclease domain
MTGVDVPLDRLLPNPFRSFDLHPIDPAHVARLQVSITDAGFWMGVVARPLGKRYELAFGHHRIEAAKASGLGSVPITVRELSNWEMIRLLASENATQRGSTAGACLDAVAAVCRQLLVDAAAERSPLGERSASAPGEPAISAALPAGTFSKRQVGEALSTLHDSGRMGALLAEFQPPGTSTGVAMVVDAPASETPVFDARCVGVFEKAAHVEAFKKAVLLDSVRSVLPVDSQLALAERVLQDLNGKEVTGRAVYEGVSLAISRGLGLDRGALRRSSLRPAEDRVRDALQRIERGLTEQQRGVDMLIELMSEKAQLNVIGQALDQAKASASAFIDRIFAIKRKWMGEVKHQQNGKGVKP